jgi:thiol peroxidase
MANRKKGGMVMDSKMKSLCVAGVHLLLMLGCASLQSTPPVDRVSVEPGGVVRRGDKSFPLLGTPVSVGDSLPSVRLVDAMTMKEVDLSQERGKVLFLNIVPSLDTRVCDAQTHYLGEKGDKMPEQVQRITISRDTPFAQKRFAKEARLTNLRYLSDHREGEFGTSMGLLMDSLKLLARSLILVDTHGKVRYIQVVPEMTHLPDMEQAFLKATQLAQEK